MNEQNLRKVLWVDVFGSGVSALFTIFGARLLAGWLDISVWVPVAVGIVLIPWVMMLVSTVRRVALRSGEVAVIVAGNIGWAVVAVVLIVGFPDALSTSGRWIVGIFSLAVLALGVLEWLGFRAMTRMVDPAVV